MADSRHVENVSSPKTKEVVMDRVAVKDEAKALRSRTSCTGRDSEGNIRTKQRDRIKAVRANSLWFDILPTGTPPTRASRMKERTDGRFEATFLQSTQRGKILKEY